MVCIPRKNITSDERLGDLLDKCIRNHPDNDAIVYVDRDIRLSWKEWGVEVDRVAKGMMAMGVQKGEKVAVWATNVPDWVTIMFATAKIGAIMLTINTNYRSAELDYVLKQSDMENLYLIDGVRDVDYVQTVYDLIPELKTQPRDSFHSEKYPHLRRVVHLGPEKYRGMYSMNEVKSLACQVSDEEYQERKDSVDVHDVTMMQYTSGTTGFPKGVMLTHFNIANDGYWLGANMNYGPTDRLCLNVPLFHCFGCVLGVMACINHGVTMCFVEVFDPVKVMTTIETEKCTAVYGVPTMFISILNHKLFNKFDFSSLRTGIMAGSPCPIKAMEDVVEKMNMREITIVYGLTEASPGMTQTTYDEPSIEKKCSSVGKKLQGVDTVILDPDTNEPCPDGVIGEFCCKGYNVMKGYYKMPEETAKIIDSNGYLHSGDLGYRDSEGYFYVTGRIKDMQGGRGLHLQLPRRQGRPGRWGQEQEVRRAGGRLRDQGAGIRPHRAGHHRLLQEGHRLVQDPEVHPLHRRVPDERGGEDPEVRTQAVGRAALARRMKTVPFRAPLSFFCFWKGLRPCPPAPESGP